MNARNLAVSCAFLVAAGCASGPAANKQTISPSGASQLAAYSPAVRSGNFVFFSGVVGLRPGTRELVSGGIRRETEQALDALRDALRAAEVRAEDVIKCTVFLADMRDYDVMTEVYGEFFKSDPPARSAVGVAGLPLGARVEIECIAAMPKPRK
jgi:reactive intermediate/imine deaminase